MLSGNNNEMLINSGVREEAVPFYQRWQELSVNPAGIIAPAIVATFVSTAVAVVYCKVKDRSRRT